MKKKLCKIAAGVLFCFFSITAFAQTAPVSFKRVHGKGTCGTAGEMRVMFDVLPAQLPSLAEVRSEARAVKMVIGNIDTSQFAKKGYVSYCIVSADNVAASKLWIRFHYENPARDYWITESINPAGL
jgi:hypothetical protein